LVKWGGVVAVNLLVVVKLSYYEKTNTAIWQPSALSVKTVAIFLIGTTGGQRV
jgi:hypothetical protein